MSLQVFFINWPYHISNSGRLLVNQHTHFSKHIIYFTLVVMACCTSPAVAEIRVSPFNLLLDSPESSQQVLVHKSEPNGITQDISRAVRYEVEPPEIAFVNDRGLVRPKTAGKGTLIWIGNPQSIQTVKNATP